MRLRHAVGAALGALVLTVTPPASAHAANGFFSYRYGLPGAQTTGFMQDPTSLHCTDIPEIEGHPLQNGFSPENRTDEDVFLFLGEDCTGARTTPKAGTSAGPLRVFKSVHFDNGS
ncbi:hypothetical protein [Streptomyces spectabilis]|uniref:Uncharacterized protein n=1 Tax=Streptomyces spectabilis TaxID=68270 RepID=A0A516R9N6_STRST|nr:hypothetical protein [Streptomyces spectabilis]QDQ12367.1 hypothetical protein FH965_18815 [Streptomyces spectabilis]